MAKADVYSQVETKQKEEKANVVRVVLVLFATSLQRSFDYNRKEKKIIAIKEFD